MQINIIDPSSTEFNRGSFCYAPYLLYNGLAEIHAIRIYETFTPENLDDILDADINIVCLWSYPQIETAILLSQFLPFNTGKNNVYFCGYLPLIKEIGLRSVSEFLGYEPLENKEFLIRAMYNYPLYYSNFKRLLLSDCDMHLQSLEKGKKVYPLFTSYGCSNACSFCPSTKNCGYRRVSLSVLQTELLLTSCSNKNIFYIHFTDEDFFFDIDRAYHILNSMKGKGFHAIALGSASAVKDFISYFGTDVITDAGLEVIEIGFESGAEELSDKMGHGKSFNSCLELAKIQHELPFRIFWLVLTFFPGETITSLNKTGQFMSQYGFNEDEVVGRLRTNGTKGGLGQFFQNYSGLHVGGVNLSGIKLTDRPIRLIPSYIPRSFLECRITTISTYKLVKADKWLALYGISLSNTELIEMSGRYIYEFFENKSDVDRIKNAILFAILARMEVIQ